MGQSLKKFGPEGEEKKAKEIEVIEKCYNDRLKDIRDGNLANFYRAVCETVEEMNKRLGYTQFLIPKADTVEKAYKKHHRDDGKQLKKEEFEKILREVIVDTGFTGIGAKDTLLYIFGVPVTALLIKQRVIPRIIPNEIFIPCVTSATVFILAKLNKI